jgi:hypothetical protein
LNKSAEDFGESGMTCVELQESLAETERGRSREQMAHLKTCSVCSELVRELDFIIAAAVELQEADEPSSRVWNSIEAALRSEGLVRPQVAGKHSVFPSFSTHWGWSRWLVPAAAMLLILIGIYQKRESSTISSRQPVVAVATPIVSTAGLNDEDLMDEVATNSPAMRSEYEENLRRVNDYIRDAQSVVNENPNDVEARHALMDAYQQKSMLFEMAMEHLQP